MRKIKILVDSCADLNERLLSEYDIDYVKMRTVYEGVETPAKLTYTKEELHTLFDMMRDKKRITTTQVPVEEFNTVFEKYLDEGCDIVYIACASKQSGSVNTGTVVAKKLLEKYTDAKIYCIDSLNASIGIGSIAIEAAKMVKEGLSVDEIYERVMALRKKQNQYVTVHSLDALRRAGRVKGPAAFFGNLMGVKPIIISDKNGTQSAFKKVKGRQNSFNEIVALLKENIINPEEQTVYVAHADCSDEEVEALVSLVRENINCKAIEVVYIGPIIGASIGPDAVGVWGFGKEVTCSIGD